MHIRFFAHVSASTHFSQTCCLIRYVQVPRMHLSGSSGPLQDTVRSEGRNDLLSICRSPRPISAAQPAIRRTQADRRGVRPDQGAGGSRPGQVRGCRLILVGRCSLVRIKTAGGRPAHPRSISARCGSRQSFTRLRSASTFRPLEKVRLCSTCETATRIPRGRSCSGGLITCFAAHGDLKKVRHVYLICYDPEDPSKKCLCRTDEVLEQVVKVFRSM